MDGWQLHPRLETDTIPVADLPLCRLLLMNDARVWWAVLVPRVAGACELHRLTADQQTQFMAEAAAVAAQLAGVPGTTKINHGALGNLVPQLHWHVVARHSADPAWPGPIWGFGTPVALNETAAAARIDWLRSATIPGLAPIA